MEGAQKRFAVVLTNAWGSLSTNEVDDWKEPESIPTASHDHNFYVGTYDRELKTVVHTHNETDGRAWGTIYKAVGHKIEERK